MGGGHIDHAGAPLGEHLRRAADRAGGVDHVVDQDAGAADDVADDHRRHGHVVAGAALVDDGQVGVEVVGQALGQLDPAGVGGDDHRLTLDRVEQVGRQDRQSGEVVDRHVEEALDLAGVEVDGHHPVGAGGSEHVGHEAGGDGLPAFRLLVLPGVAVERADGGDPLGRRPLGGVDHDQLLEEVLVDGRRVALDEEDVGAPDALQVPAVDLAVGEGRQLDLAQRHAQALGDLGGQRDVGPPAEQHQLLLRDQFHSPPRPRFRCCPTPYTSLADGRADRWYQPPSPSGASAAAAASASARSARTLAQPSSTRAGTPLARAPAGTSPVTTAPAPV